MKGNLLFIIISIIESYSFLTSRPWIYCTRPTSITSRAAELISDSEPIDHPRFYRHPFFNHTNVHTLYRPIPLSNTLWDLLVPPERERKEFNFQTLSEVFAKVSLFPSSFLVTRKKNTRLGSIGINEWIEFDDPVQGAKRMIEKCLSHVGIEKDTSTREEEDYLVFVFEYFQSLFSSTIPSQNQPTTQHIPVKFKAKIVSFRGYIGQKCPRWHVDHVPVRLVMSLLGPGCVYVPHHKEQQVTLDERSGDNHTRFVLNRTALNGLDLSDTEEANHIILPHGPDNVAISAQAGEIVLLMGRAWEEEHTKPTSEGFSFDPEAVKAAAHKSPELRTNEARVLLVVDVIA